MRRRGFTVWELLVVVVIIGVLAAILFPTFPRHNKGSARRSVCQSNLKQVMLGFKHYIQDYDEKFPRVSGGPNWGWADVLQPYLRSKEIFQCPSAPETGSQNQFRTDYFYNARLSKLEEAKIDSVALTIACGDGVPDAKTDAHVSQLPTEWKQLEASPSMRHLGSSNYAFADGHTKWLRPDKITIKPASAGAYTFAIQ